MIYLTGDLHGDLERFKSKEMKKLKKGDTLIVCGDFGFLWDGSKKEQSILKKLGRSKYQILFVEGTHDNLDLIAQYPLEDWNGGKARHISGSLYKLERGSVFTLEGRRFFVFGGGESQEMDIRQADGTWWPQELPDERNFEEARTKLGSVGWKVDYVITHTAPRACFRPRSIRRPAGITPPLIGLRHFSMSWKIAWTTSAGITGISIGMPTRPSAIPCSTTASFAWATNSSPGMLRRGGNSENFIRYLG